MADTLYDRDFYSWVQQQSGLLRQGHLNQLDVSHLIEELDDLSDRHHDPVGTLHDQAQN